MIYKLFHLHIDIEVYIHLHLLDVHILTTPRLLDLYIYNLQAGKGAVDSSYLEGG